MPEPRKPKQNSSLELSYLFTNRVEETERFLQLINAPSGTPLPLLMFYGVGGTGKSSLLNHLYKNADEQNIPVALVNLEELGDVTRALPKFALELKQRYRIKLPKFERILTILYAKESGNMTSNKADTRGDFTNVVLDGLGLIPGISEVMSFLKVGKSVAELLAKHSNIRTLFPESQNEKELKRLLELENSELEEFLIDAFAEDVYEILPERKHSGVRGVLFFDTHEALYQDGRRGKDYSDNWIQKLRELFHDKGILMVMAGRDELPWSDKDADWSKQDDQGRYIWLEQHHVGGLAREDAIQHLYKADTLDGNESQMPNELREAILAATNEEDNVDQPSSHHCYLLYLCIEIVLNTRINTGEYPPTQDFQSTSRKEIAGKLLDRFLESLDNKDIRSWLKEISLTPRFDEDYALALDQERRRTNGRTGWERLTDLSLVKSLDDKFYEMHKLFQEGLRALIPQEDAAKVHEWSWKYWKQKADSQPEHPRYWGLSWYHHRFVDADAAHKELYSLIGKADSLGNARLFRYMKDWWQDVSIDTSTVTNHVKDLMLFSRFRHYSPTNLGEAKQKWQSILKIARDLEQLSEKLDDQGIKGQVYHSIGLTLKRVPSNESKSRNEYRQEAMLYLYQALEFTSKDEDIERWGEIHRQIGSLYQNMSALKRKEIASKALFHYTEALASRGGKWPSTQNGLVLLKQGMFVAGDDYSLDEVEEIYTDLIAAYQESGSPREVWRMKINMAESSTVFGEFISIDSARCKRNVTICKELLTEVKDYLSITSWVRYVLGKLYRLNEDLLPAQRFDQAIYWLNQSLLFREKEDRPVSWAEVQFHMGKTHLTVGQEGEISIKMAISYFEEALSVFNKSSNPLYWARSHQQLGMAYLKLSNKELAKEYLEKALEVFLEKESMRRVRIIKDTLVNLSTE